MVKMKRKICANDMMQLKRENFPRKAKEQSLVNLKQLAVIMEVVEEKSDNEGERNINGNKKQRRNMKKGKKKSEILNPKCKQRVPQNQNLRSSVLSSNIRGLSHFMELGARTDLLSDSRMADPLGPDCLDNFQWVEVKQELPDDIEICKITLTELPLKINNEKETDLKIDDFKLTSDISPTLEVVSYSKFDDMEEVQNKVDSDYCEDKEDIISVAYEDKEDIISVASEDKEDIMSVASEDKEDIILVASEDKEDIISVASPSRGENPRMHSSANEDLTEKHESDNIEKSSPYKKRQKNCPQQCDICDKRLCSKGNLRLHKLKKHKLKVQFTCELCSLKFDLQREAVQHRNNVHRGDDGRFGCDLCSKRVQYYHAFLAHVQSHAVSCKEAEGSDKVCPDCDKAFLDDESLKIHHKLVHSLELRVKLKNQEKNFICDTCGRRFAFSSLLRDHINTHTGAKPYLCQECGKAFCQKSTLKQHTKTHSKVRPHQCPQCPLGFYNKGDYIKHQRKHTGERPYVCEVCGEAFSRSTHLIIHRRIHTGERPHVCDICDRGFTKRGDVVRHRRVHTGELPYLCQVCGKAFRQSTQCANHIKSKHPESPAPVARNPNPLVHGVHVRLTCQSHQEPV